MKPVMVKWYVLAGVLGILFLGGVNASDPKHHPDATILLFTDTVTLALLATVGWIIYREINLRRPTKPKQQTPPPPPQS